MTGFFDDSTPELTPVQAISPDSLPYSIFGQRFITTLMPAASARAAASSWRTVSCIQTTLGSGSSFSTSSTMRGHGVRSAKNVDHVERDRDVGQPRIDFPAEDLVAGLARD